jgi:exopolysaccharide production protein ExoQ
MIALTSRREKMGVVAKLESACLGMTALALSGALLPIIFANDNFNYVDGSPGYQTVLAVLYMMTAMIAIAHLHRILSSTLRSPALLALLLLACASVMWAENPLLVVRRTIGLVGTSLFGIVLGTLLDVDELSKLLRTVLAITAVMSLVCVFLTPQYGIANPAVYGGAWNGVFGQKNQLGAAMALGALIEWYQPVVTTRARLSRILWLWLYGTLLVCSRSSTALGSLLGTVAIIYGFRRLQPRYRVPFLFSVAAILATAMVLLTALAMGDFPVYPLGISSTLTGRTQLWALMTQMMQQHLLLGYGYGGFWGGGSKEFFLVTARLAWKPMYSHNGYLEIIVSLGLAGMILALAFVRGGIRSALWRAGARKSRRDLLPLAFLVYFLLHNIAECSILLKNDLEWALCIAFIIAVRYAKGDHGVAAQAEKPGYLLEPVREVA